MKKLLGLLIIFFTLTGCAAAVDNTPSDHSMMLYRVTNSAGNEVYVFGTMHIGHHDLYPMRAEIEEALERSDVLVVEVDIRNIDMDRFAEAQRTFPVRDLGLSDEKIEAVDTALRSINPQFNFEALQGLNAFNLFLLQETEAANRTSFTANHGMDWYLLNRAEALGMDIIEIEGLERQLEMSLYLSEFWGVELLEVLVENVSAFTIEELATGLYELCQIVLDGDSAALQLIATEMATAFPSADFGLAYYHAVLVDRDAEMVEKIKTYFESGQLHFVAVGALHLHGNSGILELLREAGYTVEKVD